MDEIVIEEKRMSINNYLNDMFKWMVIGVMVTFITAFGIEYIIDFDDLFLLPLITIALQFVVVFRFTKHLLSMSLIKTKVLYIVYAILTGITFSLVVNCYTPFSVAFAFFIAAVYFGLLILIGTFIKIDLTKIGNICIIGLGLYLVVLIISLLFDLGINMIVMSFISLALFAGITAYDMQTCLKLYDEANGNMEMIKKLSIYGAFTLYLDFVNIFLDILRIIGENK